jgi:hypothetical protein
LLQQDIDNPRQLLCSNDNTDAYSNKILSLKKETIFSLLNLREIRMHFLCSDLSSTTPRQCGRLLRRLTPNGIARSRQNVLLRGIEPPLRTRSKRRWPRIFRARSGRARCIVADDPDRTSTGAAKNVIRWTVFYQMAGDKIRQIADCSVAVR